MLTEYVFVNDEFEQIESGGYGDIEAAEKRAEYLAQKYNCQISIYEFIEAIDAPSEATK